jgi:hypothetical protein
MTASKLVLDALKSKNIPQQTIHSRKKALREKVDKAISSEVAIDIVASKEGIDVHKLLKKDQRLDELKDFKDAVSTYDFSNKTPKRQKPTKNNQKEEKSPYDLPLTVYCLDKGLTNDCRIRKPYRNAVKEALLTLEERMRTKLHVDESIHGVDLVSEAQKQQIFNRNNKGEQEGLQLLYRGAFQWLRNPPGHRKIEYSKEDAVKIVLFSDYLIRLFDDLCNKKN